MTQNFGTYTFVLYRFFTPQDFHLVWTICYSVFYIIVQSCVFSLLRC